MKKSWHISLSNTLTWCLLISVIPVLCLAQIKTTISDIISNPNRYDGKTVQVEGKVFQVEFQTSKKGRPYTILELTDGKNNVLVFSSGSLSIRKGDNVRVIGTYQKVKKAGRRVFFINATEGKIDIPEFYDKKKGVNMKISLLVQIIAFGFFVFVFLVIWAYFGIYIELTRIRKCLEKSRSVSGNGSNRKMDDPSVLESSNNVSKPADEKRSG